MSALSNFVQRLMPAAAPARQPPVGGMRIQPPPSSGLLGKYIAPVAGGTPQGPNTPYEKYLPPNLNGYVPPVGPNRPTEKYLPPMVSQQQPPAQPQQPVAGMVAPTMPAPQKNGWSLMDLIARRQTNIPNRFGLLAMRTQRSPFR